MNEIFIEQQKALALQYLESGSEKDEEKIKAIAIVVEYLSSLLDHDKYTEAEREDLRKLALEVGYKDDTDFNRWISNTLTSEDNK